MRAITPPIKWHGGKHYLADWIISHMPEHTHYVEPYFGGGAVLLKKPMGTSEVVNDLHGLLTCFWKCLATLTNNHANELIDWLIDHVPGVARTEAA